MKLTQNQKRVYSKLHKFLKNKKYRNIIILGPSGSGKTTVVTRAVFDYCAKNNIAAENVHFCAFTNKATKVIKDMVSKLIDENKFAFSSIHALLQLKPNTISADDVSNNKKKSYIIKARLRRSIYDYDKLGHYIKFNKESTNNAKDDILQFKFDYRELTNFYKIQIIVIDECSTISRELFVYIESVVRWIFDNTGHAIKIIYLGDYYQLPPVGEDESIIFKFGSDWPLYKLDKVMRANTSLIEDVNRSYLEFIDKYVKSKKLSARRIETPYMIIKNEDAYIDNYSSFLNHYVNLKEEDKIIITYTKKNCDKLNKSIQAIIDNNNNISRPPDIEYPSSYISPSLSLLKNDRIILDRSIIEPSFIVKNEVYHISENKLNSNRLFNGDVFIIEEIKKVKISTCLNKFDIPKTFNGELIKIRPMFGTQIYTIFNLNNKLVEDSRILIRRLATWDDYTDIISSFRSSFTTIKRGHCITCFKAQGSEYKHVYVNLKSFWASLLSNRRSKPRQLFSAFYTASTRASERLYLYY